MDAMVTARVPVETKREANKILEALGMTPSQAINALYEYVATNRQLPELRSEEQIMYEGHPRKIDPQALTPRMKQVIRATKAVRDQAPADWDEDAEKPFKELLDESRGSRYEALFGY